ncbi:hypothetical protein [Flavobacterium sp.]|jgi:hypothetical protein|uniref:hypothetical protein n=1 Tax=Flavobacterium sp. TaxID=239 RepID=UPI0037BE2F4A
MSTNSQDQEIDLGQISKGIQNFFQGVINSFFNFIFFLKKKIIIVSSLFVIGLALGYFLDKNGSYTQDILVIPNFESNEYLYKKIDFLNSRIIENDTVFFKSIGISNSEIIGKLEIKAINGVFQFVNQGGETKQNFELLKLMAEEGNIQEIVKSDVASKNYYLHNITFKTSEKASQKGIINPILNYLQDNNFYKIQQKIYQKNNDNKIQFNDSLIVQIDKLILNLSNNKGGNISFSEEKGISELINKKDQLIKETQSLIINRSLFEEIIKTQNVSINNINTKGLNHKMKLFLPILFIILYVIIYNFIVLYKKQMIRIKE